MGWRGKLLGEWYLSRVYRFWERLIRRLIGFDGWSRVGLDADER